MKLKDLSKEQKQYVALGLLSVAILVILIALGIRFSLATISTAKEELDVLTDKINRANQALSRSKQISEEYQETIAVLKKYLTNAPPERNYYSWATEVIYSKARLADLEIESIDEITIPDLRRSGSDADAAAISFESYSLRIMGNGGYENTKYFINLLKKDYPLVRFSGVEISSGQNPEAHDVQLFMQWPFNFDDITKNWEAIANTQIKMAESNWGDEVASPAKIEPASEPENTVATVIKPDPVCEPHPPTTRPDGKETPVPALIVEQTPQKQPMLNTALPMESSSVDVTLKPAAREEIQAILSGPPLPAGKGMTGESQHEIRESLSGVEPYPAAEPEIADSGSRPVVEPGIENMSNPNPVPDSAFEQKIVERTGESDSPGIAVLPGSPEAVFVPEAPRSYLATRKSEKNFEELVNAEIIGQDATLSSFLDVMLGEINEK